jgi:hypothetical protein
VFVRVTSVVPTSRARENYSNQRACRVRFTPNSDRESGFPHKVMSALPQKADMCGTARDVCFGPKADMGFPSWSACLLGQAQLSVFRDQVLLPS